MADPVQIPRHIDDPVHLLLWTVDEWAPTFLGLFLGIMFGHPVLITAMGVAMSSLYGRFRAGRQDGYLLHMLYWMAFIPAKGAMRNPLVREYLP